MTPPHERVDADELVERRARRLADGARGDRRPRSIAGDLPAVTGDAGAAHRGVPEPDRQRDQVPRPTAPPRVTIAAERDGALLALHVRRQRHRHRADEYAERIFVIFQRLHTARRVRRHRHRPGDVPQDRRVPRRPHLARPRRARPRRDLPFTLPAVEPGASPRHERTRDDLEPIDILLVEDDPGDVLMIQRGVRGQQGAQPAAASSPTASRRSTFLRTRGRVRRRAARPT